MDAGFFLDTPDIHGRLTWRESVQRLFKFHRMGAGIHPACQRAHLKQPWKCLLPQYNLPFVRTPVFVVNSLQDEIAVKMTFSSPLIDGTVRIQKCMDRSPLCPLQYRTALQLYQARLLRSVLAIQRAKRRQGVWFESFLMNSSAHCTAVYGDWVGRVDVLGRQLPRVLEDWFFHGRPQAATLPGRPHGGGFNTSGGARSGWVGGRPVGRREELGRKGRVKGRVGGREEERVGGKAKERVGGREEGRNMVGKGAGNRAEQWVQDRKRG
ncbi:hypothetical protein CLOM_g11006 [Closterium sp. NIES-68]|nr:hypothetical protein CLOM_g11006 [Closterium sp. NIES-68]